MRDVAVARTARDLFALALAGARRLGEGYVTGGDLDVATQFYVDYTARDRSPADDRALPVSTTPVSAEVRSPN